MADATQPLECYKKMSGAPQEGMGESSSNPGQGFNHIIRILQELLPQVKNLDPNDTDTLHAIYSFASEAFDKICHIWGCSSTTRQHLLTLRDKIEDHHRILRQHYTRSLSYPESEPDADRPIIAVAQQESMQEGHRDLQDDGWGNIDDTPSESCDHATPAPSKHSFGYQETSI